MPKAPTQQFSNGLSGDGILSAQASTFLGADIGIKNIAAVHSRCPNWVNNCRTARPEARQLCPHHRTRRQTAGAAETGQEPTYRLLSHPPGKELQLASNCLLASKRALASSNMRRVLSPSELCS